MKSTTFSYRSFIVVFAACLTLVAAGCVKKIAPMLTPTFQVATSDSKRIHEAIRSSLVQRKWVILKNGSNAIEAKYTRGNQYAAHIRVSHVGKQVTITHVDSQDLMYSQGNTGPVIHRWYNTWVTNLEHDIQVAIGAGL